MYKKPFSGLALTLLTVLIASCSTEPDNSAYYHSPIVSNLAANPTPANPSSSSVKIYGAGEAPTQTTTPISMVEIDLYNQYGIKRQRAEVNEILKEQACSLGGNAVILIDNADTKHCYAEVVHIDQNRRASPNNAVSSPSTSATSPVSVKK